MSNLNELTEWLNQKYIEWLGSQGRRGTLVEFAGWLEVHPATLTNWMNGVRTPRFSAVKTLATKLGPEVYEIMNMLPPDADCRRLVKHWHVVSDENKRKIISLLDHSLEFRHDK